MAFNLIHNISGRNITVSVTDSQNPQATGASHVLNNGQQFFYNTPQNRIYVTVESYGHTYINRHELNSAGLHARHIDILHTAEQNFHLSVMNQHIMANAMINEAIYANTLINHGIAVNQNQNFSRKSEIAGPR